MRKDYRGYKAGINIRHSILPKGHAAKGLIADGELEVVLWSPPLQRCVANGFVAKGELEVFLRRLTLRTCVAKGRAVGTLTTRPCRITLLYHRDAEDLKSWQATAIDFEGGLDDLVDLRLSKRRLQS